MSDRLLDANGQDRLFNSLSVGLKEIGHARSQRHGQPSACRQHVPNQGYFRALYSLKEKGRSFLLCASLKNSGDLMAWIDLPDRKSVVEGKSVDLGGRRIIK